MQQMGSRTPIDPRAFVAITNPAIQAIEAQPEALTAKAASSASAVEAKPDVGVSEETDSERT
jgi:hypothetical protein